MTLDFVSLTMVKVIGEFNGSAIPVQPIREGANDFAHTIYAKLLGPINSLPRVGDTGVIIQKNKDDQMQVFYIGSLVTEVNQDANETAISCDNGSVSISDDKLNIQHKSGSITQDKSGTIIENNNNSVIVSENNISMNVSSPDATLAKLDLSQKQNTIYTEGNNHLISKADTHIQSKSAIMIHGDLDSEDSYKPSLNFDVSSRNISLRANGGPVYIEGGKISLNFTDAMTTHTIPGLGGSTTFEMSILNGDIDVSTKAGNIYLSNFNSTSIGVIKIANGSLLSPTGLMETSLELSIRSVDLKQSIIPELLEAKVSMSEASLNLIATKGINLETESSIKATALMNIELSGALKIAMETLKAEIIADIQMDLKTTLLNLNAEKTNLEASIATLKMELATISGKLLNLTDMKTIKTGPKTVVPSAVGPLNCISMCPWNGQLHTGEIANG